jgi:F-type H+-transporting ATPase subunit b
MMAAMLVGVPVALAASSGGHGSAPEAGHGNDAHGGTKGWVTTDTYRVMNFAVLAIGLFVLLRKPLSQALGGRIAGIRQQLADLEARKTEAETQLAQYAQRLATLQAESQKIVAEYVRQGEEAKGRILREAETAAGKLEEQARRNIEHEFQTARARLQEEIMGQAITRAEALLREKINADDQNRLVADYLQKVVAQ